MASRLFYFKRLAPYFDKIYLSKDRIKVEKNKMMCYNLRVLKFWSLLWRKNITKKTFLNL